MRLDISYTTLLASLFVALALVGDADGRPLARQVRKEPITLPLTRLNQARDDLHPQLRLQMQINRGVKRLARMTGSAEPSDHELRDALHKRMYLLPGGPGSHNRKRYNPIPLPSLPPTSPATNVRLGELDEASGPAGPNNAAEGDTGATQRVGADGPSAEQEGISPISVDAAFSGGLTEAKEATASQSIPLDIEANDVGYLATVQIGTPPRDFRLLVDSGSADTWVGGEVCRSTDGGGCGNHTFLGPQSSSSFVDSRQAFQVQYGAGNVAGSIVADDMTVAGLQLPGHIFGAASLESPEFSSDRTLFDGLMGLAQSSLSNQGVPTPVEALALSGLVTDAVTSYKLGRIADGVNDGQITFGGVDATKIKTETLTTFPNVNPNGFWEAPMVVSLDGQDLGLDGRTGILDTGTTLILAPPADAEALHAAIPGARPDGQGGFIIPCTTNTSISMNFAGREFAIDPRDLLFLPVDPNNLQGDCVSGIVSGQIGGPTQWLIGDVFLKNAYFVTDVGRNEISLAKLS